MDALTIIVTVCTLAKSIKEWIEACSEKKAVTRQIAQTVDQVQHILSPLQEGDLAAQIEPQTLGIVKSIGSSLTKTQEHLFVWRVRPSRRILAMLSPSSVVKELKEDDSQLKQQLIMLIASISVIGFVEKLRKRHPIHPSSIVGQSIPVLPQSVVLGPISNKEVREFWSGYVGAELPYISGDEFCTRLGVWMGQVLDTTTRKGLMLRIDEFAIGGITPADLQSVVGTGSLRGFVNIYSKDSSLSPSTSSSLQKRDWWYTNPNKQKVALPLLVWIDDHPLANIGIVREAQNRGINVVQLKSTAIAKDWVKSHSDFLRYNDHPSKVRFISDNHRNEHTTRIFLNMSAGENILRYLRGRKYKFPVLIYCGRSINQTTYVQDHTLSGSTNSPHVTTQYVRSLAEGKSDDTKWMGFNTMGI
ncbi:hypothetical protein BDZ94DRAFT_1314782 [Collybia nuda]|uniref:Uncharacterized protein n=1 Tax=Collybia nuda TaxID=64659 RepID=A0A9P6CDA9_9AGAR|nr:hypothetical protein BDZ94DRAFT_1314782 [Collybia nuda]